MSMSSLGVSMPRLLHRPLPVMRFKGHPWVSQCRQTGSNSSQHQQRPSSSQPFPVVASTIPNLGVQQQKIAPHGPGFWIDQRALFLLVKTMAPARLEMHQAIQLQDWPLFDRHDLPKPALVYEEFVRVLLAFLPPDSSHKCLERYQSSAQ